MKNSHQNTWCKTSIMGACLGLILTTSACGDAPDRSSALNAIEAESIRAHIEVLADDALEGREAGTRGYDSAALYVANEFDYLGLTPLGDDGDWYQEVPFMQTQLDIDSARVELSGQDEALSLTIRDDFIMSGGYGPASNTGPFEQSVTAPLVFVGYGIQSPDNNMDDFAGIDLNGKIAVMLSGAPASFAGAMRAYHSSGRTKQELAEKMGAVGIVTIRTPVDEARRSFDRYLPGLDRPGMHWIGKDGAVFESFPGIKGSATLSPEGAKKLMRYAGADLDGIFANLLADENGNIPGTESFELGISATLARTSHQSRVQSSNVVAMIEGSDPELKDEYVVYSGHLDHIGIREAKGDDHIHNGAYDNATGVSVILEIARAMKELPVAPRRSIIFAIVTGEEKGLQGSAYFTANPPVPVTSMVANINIDMPFLGLPVADLVPIGAEHSTLMAAIEQAAEATRMQVTPDPLPEEVRFVRSDQFRFVQAGIPAVAFKPGSKSRDQGVDGEKRLDDFLKRNYHKPSDDLSLNFDSAAAQRFARAGLLTGLIVADDDQRPTWLEGDFFGTKYSRN